MRPRTPTTWRILLDADEVDDVVLLEAFRLAGTADDAVAIATRPGTSSELRREALGRLPDERVGEVVALVARAPSLWAELLLRVAEGGDPTAVRAVAEWLDHEDAAAFLTHRTELHLPWKRVVEGSTALEDAFTLSQLHVLLQVDDLPLQIAAVQWLGATGSVEVVADLRRRETVAPERLRLAIGQAVRRIQERVDGGAGALSVAPQRGGGLAIPEGHG